MGTDWLPDDPAFWLGLGEELADELADEEKASKESTKEEVIDFDDPELDIEEGDMDEEGLL